MYSLLIILELKLFVDKGKINQVHIFNAPIAQWIEQQFSINKLDAMARNPIVESP